MMQQHRPQRPALEPEPDHVAAVVFSIIAIILAVASVASGKFNGLAVGAILFAAAAVVQLWEDAR